MNIGFGNKWKLRAAALLIFLLGAAAGALAPRAYSAWFREGRQRQRERFEQMLDRLQLSAEQRTQVQQTLGEAREQFRSIRRESEGREDEVRRRADERLRQIMTPEQWQQFQQMMSERGGQRRGRRGRGGGREGSSNSTPPPPPSP